MSYDQAKVIKNFSTEYGTFCESLTNNTEAYRLIVEHIDQGAAILAANGTILYANRRLAIMLGLSLKSLIGSFLLQHLPHPNPDLFETKICNFYNQKETIVWRRNQAILEQKTADLITAKQAAEQASRTKNIFLATMSHELRTPMNAIIGFNELLIMTEKDDNRRNKMNIIKEAGNSLLQLIRNMLDLSKIEAGQTTVYEENFILSELIYAVLSMFEAQALSKMITLSTVIDSRLPIQIYSDSGLLKQILTNLIGNAIKFTNSGSICIKVEYDNKLHQEPNFQCFKEFCVYSF